MGARHLSQASKQQVHSLTNCAACCHVTVLPQRQKNETPYLRSHITHAFKESNRAIVSLEKHRLLRGKHSLPKLANAAAQQSPPPPAPTKLTDSC